MMPVMLYLRGISARGLNHVLDFIYKGSINLAQEELDDFLAVGESLQVRILFFYYCDPFIVSEPCTFPDSLNREAKARSRQESAAFRPQVWREEQEGEGGPAESPSLGARGPAA